MRMVYPQALIVDVISAGLRAKSVQAPVKHFTLQLAIGIARAMEGVVSRLGFSTNVLDSRGVRNQRARLNAREKVAIADSKPATNPGSRVKEVFKYSVMEAATRYYLYTYLWATRRAMEGVKTIHVSMDSARLGGVETELCVVMNQQTGMYVWAPPQGAC